MDQIRISRTLLTRLDELGIAPADVLRQARLPQTLFNQERVVVTVAQWFALWKALATFCEPGFGLKLASDPQVVQNDPLSIISLSAPSFHDALTKMARYKRLFCSEEIRILEQDGSWSIEAMWVATQDAAPPMIIDSMFASLIELGRRGTGHALYPERVLLRREPIHRAMYEAHFRCPVTFNADRNMIFFSHEAMEKPFRTYNPDLIELLEPQLEAALRKSLPPQTTMDQVKAWVRSRLAGQQLTIQDAARELFISARTLQRRLADEGASFQQLLESVRREMAQQYLTKSSFDLSEIAYLLGYEEASSFHRAFHNWEGTSPGQWRAAQHTALSSN